MLWAGCPVVPPIKGPTGMGRTQVWRSREACQGLKAESTVGWAGPWVTIRALTPSTVSLHRCSGDGIVWWETVVQGLFLRLMCHYTVTCSCTSLMGPWWERNELISIKCEQESLVCRNCSKRKGKTERKGVCLGWEVRSRQSKKTPQGSWHSRGFCRVERSLLLDKQVRSGMVSRDKCVNVLESLKYCLVWSLDESTDDTPF